MKLIRHKIEQNQFRRQGEVYKLHYYTPQLFRGV